MITYEYDEGGNILSKKEYFYYGGSASSRPSETITYTYGNTNWKDQLTSYNGKAITYDEIGNIVTYDGNTYTWQNGRQLAGIRDSNQTITYKYNDNGIRTQKTINGTTTNYYVDGNKVIYEKTGSNIIYYTYDENGNIIGLNYNNTQYYYIRNGQNDVIGILDSNLNQVVSYEYDSWGNTISIKDANGNNITSSSNIGIINPYRYRSYRYDTETGLYYLNSRYYNPEWGRFINADNLVSTGQGLLSHNMYAYCNNNPIMNADPNGHLALISFIIGVVATAIITATTVAINNNIQQQKAQQEIARVQSKSNIPDCTDELNNTLKTNANNVRNATKNMNTLNKLKYIAQNTKTNSKYDLKRTPEWNKTISYNGIIMEAQDIGNFHFGYIGRAAGLSKKTLTVGAGIYQIYSGTSTIGYLFTPSFGDDPRDTYYIKMGVMAYDGEY